MMLKITLSIVTILALLQPFIFFYILKQRFFLYFFPLIGLLFTLYLLFITNKQKSRDGSFNVIWSLVILLIGFVTFANSMQWAYVVDAMVLMTEREAIVKKIKADKNLNQQLDYTHSSILPVALHNNVVINEIETDKLTIKFETMEDGFFSVHSKGVLYSDKPEKIDDHDNLRNEVGVIFESSFRVKKIKPNWYFYEFEERIIWD
jgi:hypothetical protein